MNLSDPLTKQAAPRIIGVDLSHWQGNIDFAKLAYHNTRFAIFKAGEIPTGSKTEFTDPKYARNMSEARNNGIITGAYYFFHPAIGASRQARHFDAVMDNFGRPDLPPVIDVESTDNMEPAKIAPVLKAMIDALVARGYRLPIIYSRWGFLVNQVGEPFWLKDHYLWLAQYNTTLTNKPRDMSKVIIWQYTDKLRLAGIGVNIDGNYWLKSEAELNALVNRPVIEQEPQSEPIEVVEEPQNGPVEETPATPVDEVVVVIEDPLPDPVTQTGTAEPIEIPVTEPESSAEQLPEPASSPSNTPQSFWVALARFIHALLAAFSQPRDS